MVLPRRLIAACLVLALVGAAVVTVERLWFAPFHVPTTSMVPTLRPGDRVVVDRRVAFSHLHRGDVIVFAADDSDDVLRGAGNGRNRDAQHAAFPAPGSDGSRLLVKRVVALPGETIEAHDGFVVINGKRRLTDRWLGDRAELDIAPVELRSDEVFVVGDNHRASLDSRAFGPVPRRSLVGRVKWIAWPWSRHGSVR